MTPVQPVFKVRDRIIWRWPAAWSGDVHPIHTGTILGLAEDGWLYVVEDKSFWDGIWFPKPQWINIGKLNLCKHVVE